MWHITFNYLDHSIQLRLLALFAAALFIVCLGIWEFSDRVGIYKATTLVVLLTLSGLTLAYTLAVLGGIV